MNIAQWLYSRALVSPDAPALFTGEKLHANYGDFARNASAIGASLSQRFSVQAGDRVVLCMKNRCEYLSLLYAIWWVGAVAVPINYKLHAKEAAWVIDNAEAKVLFSDDGALHTTAKLNATCHEVGVDSDDFAVLARSDLQFSQPLALDSGALAWLFYTSGTTGRPKGVMLSHRNLIAMSLCYAADVDDVSSDDAILYAAPMSHGAGLYNFINVRSGARHVVPTSRGFDCKEILDLAEGFGHLSFFAAPTMVKRLVNEAKATKRNGAGIKSIIYGGGPMYTADIEAALNVFGPKFIQIYGQGESPMTITALGREIISDSTHPKWRERLASVGTAQACVEVRVVDENMADVPSGSQGEIIVRGDAVMDGYWRNKEASQQTLIAGWLKTGDIGHLDEDGFLTLTDRSKDVIISGGTNIYPREVEEVLVRHPDVSEVAVIGSPNPEWGEEVVAFMVFAHNAHVDERALDAWCRGEMASFKKPRRYEFCSELPKNTYGEVLKTELRKLLQESAKSAPSGCVATISNLN